MTNDAPTVDDAATTTDAPTVDDSYRPRDAASSVTTRPRRPLRIVGTRTETVSPDHFGTLPRRELEVEIVCESGDRDRATWCGVGVEKLLSVVGTPPDTTHLVFESVDGYRACVDVRTAIGGVIALERDGLPLRTTDHDTRFVAPGVRGPRTVTDVECIEAVQLPPGTDPETRENLRGSA